MRSRCNSWLVLAGLTLTSLGCYGSNDDEVVVIVPQGTLTVQWSIVGELFPEDCALVGAESFELLLYDRFGAFFLEINTPCEAFQLSVALPEDLYNADATLVDQFDFAVTLTEPLDGLGVISGTELVVSIDYPPGSFL